MRVQNRASKLIARGAAFGCYLERISISVQSQSFIYNIYTDITIAIPIDIVYYFDRKLIKSLGF